MKVKYIIAIVLIAASIAAILSTYGDASTYVNFEKARAQAGKEFHVVGVLDKTQPMVYTPEKDPNYFSFYMADDRGEIVQVVYHSAKPQDFDHSEKIVIVGAIEGNTFEASQILLKCPSKYKDEQAATGKINS